VAERFAYDDDEDCVTHVCFYDFSLHLLIVIMLIDCIFICMCRVQKFHNNFFLSVIVAETGASDSEATPIATSNLKVTSLSSTGIIIIIIDVCFYL
jgi:hypothetical protein